MKNHKLEGNSYIPQKGLIEALRINFPSVFSDGKVNPEQLRLALGEDCQLANERYGLSWAGKNDCFLTIQEPTTATLKPTKDESVAFDKTENLFIEGDNLEVLKVLQRSYYGKVKCIYIDPPYNTGNDFIYNDKFGQSKQDYQKEVGDMDENGNIARADGLSRNTKESGHYHSNWLNMMYPRLFLARNLLRQEGVIFVSIDDNEVHNLRMIMNEIFGEENFVASIIWQKKYSPQNDATYFSNMHDYVLCYAKLKKENISDDYGWKRNLLPRSEAQNARYSNQDNDPRGDWKSGDLLVKTYSAKYDYEIITPSGRIVNPPKGRCWRVSKEKYEQLVSDNRIWFGADGNAIPSIKRFLSEVQQGVVPSSIWFRQDVGDNQEASVENKELMGGIFFDTPKPVRLVKEILKLSTNRNDDIVLDFFAGSGTTAHAVMAQNAEDGGNRKWVCVQLPERCDEESESYKSGYKNIADIAKERIRRAGKSIKKDGIDTGFKVLKLDKSNFKIWQGKFEDTKSLLQEMEKFVDNVEYNSTQENILYELILKSGLDLNVPAVEKDFQGEKYYDLDNSKLIVYLGEKISKEMGEFFQSQNPEKIICLERAFKNNDELKTNILLQAEQEDVDFKVV